MKLKALLFALLGMPLVAVAVLYSTGSFRTKQLEVLGEVPNFNLTERSGSTLSRDALKGKVWIANFVFTHCSVQCPRVSGQMKRLQGRLGGKENLRLVTFTVDPERDTAKALADYAKKLDADPKRWFFLTGKRPDLEQLIQKGFHLATPEAEEGGESMTHSLKLVLVDASSRIRGYYDGMDEKAVKGLMADANGLLRETF